MGENVSEITVLPEHYAMKVRVSDEQIARVLVYSDRFMLLSADYDLTMVGVIHGGEWVDEAQSMVSIKAIVVQEDTGGRPLITDADLAVLLGSPDA